MVRRLRLPETLAFAVLTAGAVVAAASCEGGDSKGDGCIVGDAAVSDAAPADAHERCTIFCIPDQVFDDGGPVIDGGPACPLCADENGHCPSGCRPVG
jgi:hypothetical protein